MTAAYNPAELQYTETHEWIHIAGDLATIGLTDFAQEQLSDVVWVELPEPDDVCEAGQVLATVESVKAAGDVYAPVSGTVTEVNARLTESPELINSVPYASWFCRIRIADLSDLTTFLSLAEYAQSTQPG